MLHIHVYQSLLVFRNHIIRLRIDVSSFRRVRCERYWIGDNSTLQRLPTLLYLR